MWTLRSLIPVFLIGLILSLCALPFMASVPPPSPSTSPQKPAVKMRQVGEYVFSHECITLAPNRDFEVHIPLKDNGDLDTTKIVTTGNVIVTPISPKPHGCNVRLNIRHVEEQ